MPASQSCLAVLAIVRSWGGIGPGFGTCLGVSKPMTDAQTLNICMPTYSNIMGRTQNYGPILVKDYITAPNIKG